MAEVILFPGATRPRGIKQLVTLKPKQLPSDSLAVLGRDLEILNRLDPEDIGYVQRTVLVLIDEARRKQRMRRR